MPPTRGSQGTTENTPLVEGPKDLEGRQCTDVACFGIFVIFWIVLATLFAVVFTTGDVHKIIHGVDYEGNVCGYAGSNVSGSGANLNNKPKIWYPRIAADVSEQPDAFATGAWWNIDLYGVCVERCPTFDINTIEEVPDYGWGHFHGSKAPKWPVYMDTNDIVNRCIPRKEVSATTVVLCTMPTCGDVPGATCSPLSGTMGVPAGAWEMNDVHLASTCGRQIDFTYAATVEQPGSNDYIDWMFASMTNVDHVLEGLAKNWAVLLVCGVVFAVLINFAWLLVFYCFAKVAVWLAIWLILLSFALGATFSFIKGGLGEAIAVAELSNATGSDFPPDLVQMGSAVLAPVDEEYKEHMISAGVLFSILFLIAAILVCCGRQAIDRCVVLIEQASLALGSTPGLAIMPAIVSMLQLGVVLLCAFTLTVVPTMTMEGTLEGRLHETTGDKALEDWGLWSIALYIGFGAIWTYCFLTALTLMTVAACVFYFYFVNKATVPAKAYMAQYDDNQTSWPVLKHLKWVLRYHIGTIAFGSAVLAIVMFIQLLTKALFAYLEKNLQANSCLKVASCCVLCCLQCFKKTIEFINAYAYIYCFVENVGFCQGCASTFALILRYPTQIAINTAVQRVLSALLTLTTPLACGTIAYAYFDFMASDADTHTGNGALLLPFSVFVLALLMTFAFAGVWEQVVNSLTVCVIHDVESFDGKFLRESMKTAFDNPKKPKATVMDNKA